MSVFSALLIELYKMNANKTTTNDEKQTNDDVELNSLSSIRGLEKKSKPTKQQAIRAYDNIINKIETKCNHRGNNDVKAIQQ